MDMPEPISAAGLSAAFHALRDQLGKGSWDTIDGTVKFDDYEGYTHQN